MILSKLVLFGCILGIGETSHHHVSHSEHAREEDQLAHSKAKIYAKRVAIVGAGAAGASTGYHLSQFAAAAGIPVNITVFERNPYIGGRTTTVNVYGDPSQPVELGGSIFVEVNKIMMDAVKGFNLSLDGDNSTPATDDGPQLGIWNGKEFVLTTPAEATWWDTAKLLWKYGLAPIRTMRLMKKTVGKFLRLYDEPLFPWSSLSEVADTLGLSPDVTGLTGEQFLEQNGIGELFARDVIQASTRVNYASNLGLIHGLETMVCMATDGAHAVVGGNWQIFASMLKDTTNANVRLNTTVTGMKLASGNSYVVQYVPTGSAERAYPTSNAIEQFDTVVLAGPYQYANITMDPLPLHVPDKIPYVELHVTLFASPHLLSPEAFNLASGSSTPVVVLTTLPPDENHGSDPNGVGSPGFFSISTLGIAANPETAGMEFLYKIFSPGPVSNDFLAKYWGFNAPSSGDISRDDISWIYRKVWNSYPYEYPRVTFDELRLDENLWYTSAIESFISTMETSALSGKNVAKLIVDDWVERGTTVKNASVENAYADVAGVEYPAGGEQQPLDGGFIQA